MLDQAWQTVVNFAQSHSVWLMVISWFIFAVGMLQNIINAIQLPAAWLELKRHSQAEDTESTWQLLISDVAVPISVLVPAYNEAATIVANVRSMLFLQYPDVEIVVINDGSSDNTLEVLIEAFSLKPVSRAHEIRVPHAPMRGLYASKLYPGLLVVDKENGKGKADATNAGVNFSRNPLYCVVDADSLLEPEALLRSVRPFMENPAEMVAVGGTIRVLNGCTVVDGQIVDVALPNRFLPLVQSLEYIRAFLMARLAWSHWGMLSIVSGAFGIFRRDLTIEVNGFSRDTVGEDYDLVVKLHRHMMDNNKPYAMRYVPEPVCWTEAPETLNILGNQRKRWQRGAIEVMLKNRSMVLNPRYGKFGMLGLTNNLLVDVIGPIAELLGYLLIPLFWSMGVLNFTYIAALIAIFMVFGVFISVSTLILEEMELKRMPRASDLAWLGLMAVVENFGYRQLNSIWRMMGSWQFLRKDTSWGEMVRKGAVAPAKAKKD